MLVYDITMLSQLKKWETASTYLLTNQFHNIVIMWYHWTDGRIESEDTVQITFIKIRYKKTRKLVHYVFSRWELLLIQQLYIYF